MDKFKVGDRVLLYDVSEWNTGEEDNPINKVGIIIEIRTKSYIKHKLPITVRWSKGITNTYNPHDLYHATLLHEFLAGGVDEET